MAVDIKASKASDLLQRSNIRTMKKDLNRLRELEISQESEKIIGSSALKNEPQKPSFSPPTSPQPLAPEPMENIAAPMPITPPTPMAPPPTPKKIELEAIPTSVEKYATEIEKQQIFLLRSQLVDLKRQQEVFAKEQTTPTNQQKDKMASAQKHWQDRLVLVIEKEKKASEDQKEALEKQRWQIEQELAKLASQTKNENDSQEKFSQQEKALEIKVAQVENSLKIIYNTIAKRAEEASKPPVKHIEVKPTVHHESKAPTPSHRQPKEHSYLKEVPEATKEKLSEITKTENSQRRKFMEDVERWASTGNHEE